MTTGIYQLPYRERAMEAFEAEINIKPNLITLVILVVFRTVLLVQRPWTNLWKGRFINTNYYYYYYYY